MAQDFFPTFDPNDQVQITMQEIFKNTISLRSNFSGDSTPGTEPYQWWADNGTGDDILKLSNGTGSFIDVYNITTGEVLLKSGQVEATHISNAARKPSLIDLQAINPSSCTHRATFGTVSTPQYSPFTSSFTQSGWKVVNSSIMYVPSDGGQMYMRAKLERGKMRFIIGSTTSSETNYNTGGPTWSTEASADLASLSGWQDVQIQCSTSSGLGGSITGLQSRWS